MAAWCNIVLLIQSAELNCGHREVSVILRSYLTFYRSAPFLCEIRFIKFSPALYLSLPFTYNSAMLRPIYECAEEK